MSPDVFQGVLPRAGESVETLERRGRDYSRFRTVGLRNAPVELFTADYVANLSAAVALESSYAALRGTSVTVTDSHGTAYANCVVLDVRITQKAACVQAGGVKYRVAAVWTIQPGDPWA